jgi:glucan biosynthesis protein C
MRLHFLDNLRFALTHLVILHHTSIAYGGGGEWDYRSSHHSDVCIPLLAFTAFNQSFFMGTFFFIGGIFSRVALARKGSKSFIKDKLLRLALPALVYTLVATPIQGAILQVVVHHRSPSGTIFWNHWSALRGKPGVRGPVWFLVLLFLFDCVYAICSSIRPRKPSHSTANLGDKSTTGLIRSMRTPHCIAGILLCSFVSFLVRLQYPASHVYRPFNLRLGYIPQYIFLYVFGLIVDPAEIILMPRHAVRAILAIITAVVVLTFPANYRAGTSTRMLEEFSGGMNSKAATYALLNELVGYILFANSIQLFRSYSSASWGPVTGLSYGIFLVHAPVSVVVETLTDSWLAGAVTKTVAIGALNSLCTIGAAWLLKQVPGVRRAV